MTLTPQGCIGFDGLSAYNSESYFPSFSRISYVETIRIGSFGSTIAFPHLLHLTTSNGSYIGRNTLTLGSAQKILVQIKGIC